jgi:hypothetical protein
MLVFTDVDDKKEFHIEPESASGRPDLISAQTGKDRLVADVKVFNPERGQNTAYITTQHTCRVEPTQHHARQYFRTNVKNRIVSRNG